MRSHHRFLNYIVFFVALFCKSSLHSNVVSTGAPCVVKGQFNTHLKWYGYLLQKTLQTEAKIEYQVSYPERECCVNMLIYYDDQIKLLTESMSCQERAGILPDKNNQVIALSIQNHTKGCERYHPSSSSEPLIVCTGERTLRSTGPRTWYIAVSRCNAESSKPLDMSYYFNVTNFFGVCEVDPLSNTYIPVRVESDSGVIVALGVVCGITTITAIVFAILFFFGRYRRRDKKKAGSVTSSQATMTQDIFYVNPSLSDREQSDSQYSHSQSSGSENYYEVIPDRRSYESINTQLALQGQSLRGIHLSHGRENRPNIPPYILEDYPPPPYQPPPLQNGVHHRQSSANAVLQGQNQPPQTTQAGTTPLLNGQMIANGRPVHMNPGIHYNSTNLLGHNRSEQTLQKQIPVGNQSLRIYSQRAEHTQGQMRPQSSQGNQTISIGTGRQNLRSPPQMSDNSQQTNTPFSQANGCVGSTNFTRQTIASAAKMPNGVASGQNIQLQTCNPNQIQQTSSSVPSSNGRQNIPNGNVAKLLHDAYRIQQFETTA